MTQAIIQADYEELRRVASMFNAGYENVHQLQSRLDQATDGLKQGGWVADAAFRYYDSMDNDVLMGMQRLSTALQNGDATVIAVIRIFAQADEEAAACLQGMSEDSAIDFILRELKGTGSEILVGLGLLFSTEDLDGGFRAPNALISFLTAGFVDNQTAKYAIGLVDSIRKNGFSAETIAEFFVKKGLSAGFKSFLSGTLKLGSKAAIVPLISDAIQLIGGVQHDSSILIRNILTGGDSSLMSYGTMTDAINEYAGVLTDINLSGVIGSASEVVVDFGIQPVFERMSAVYNDPSPSNLFNLGVSVLGRANPLTMGMTMSYDMATMPEMRNEAVTNVFKFGGDVLDFTTGLGRLPTMSMEHSFDMGIGISQNFIERLPIETSTQNTLLGYSQSIQDHANTFFRATNFLTPLGPLGEINRAIDFSDTFEGFAHQLLN